MSTFANAAFVLQLVMFHKAVDLAIDCLYNFLYALSFNALSASAVAIRQCWDK